MDKFREGFAVFCMEHKVTEAPFYWKLWQAAWNARQTEVKMLDLGGLQRYDFKSRDYNYADMVRSHDGAWIRYSDLTDKLLPPVVGYSREQMVTAMEWADVTDHYIKEDRDEYLSDLTPAAQPQPLIEALEDIAVDDGVDETSAKIAREALAEWKGGLNE